MALFNAASTTTQSQQGICTVRNSKNKQIGQVRLDPVRNFKELNGRMSHFYIVEGGRGLWQCWFDDRTVTLIDSQGNQATAKIVAFPHPKEHAGYMQFLSVS